MKLIRLLNVLSIDVALGSIALGILAVKITNVSMPLAWWLALPSTVWLMYSADHLLDGYGRKIEGISARHLFHQRNFSGICIACVCVAVFVLLTVVFFLPTEIIYHGLVIALACLAYLAYTRRLGKQFIPKEVIVALIYTTGIWFGPLMYLKITFVVIIPVILTFVTAINNLIVFSIFGMKEDASSGFNSMAISLGEVRIMKIGESLLWIAMVISMGYLAFHSEKRELFISGIIFMVINLVLLVMLKQRHFFARQDRYRIVGDGIFILPAVLSFF